LCDWIIAGIIWIILLIILTILVLLSILWYVFAEIPAAYLNNEDLFE
jgi:hypothetical protein